MTYSDIRIAIKTPDWRKNVAGKVCVYSYISLLRCMCISKRHESLSSM